MASAKCQAMIDFGRKSRKLAVVMFSEKKATKAKKMNGNTFEWLAKLGFTLVKKMFQKDFELKRARMGRFELPKHCCSPP